jgi:quinol-cytochrome oxidoreductase complex cytochrome b subunit
MVQRVVDWVDERVDLSGSRHFIAEKGVPVHTQKIWYYLGGMTMFLLAVQIFTGILLLLYYRPSATEAYERSGSSSRGAVWMADSQHPQLVGESPDGSGFAHFFSVFP